MHLPRLHEVQEMFVMKNHALAAYRVLYQPSFGKVFS